jgi:hypothetical protein
MKLGKLNSAIRVCSKVRVPIVFPNGEQTTVLVQKTDLIKQLQEAYGKQRAEETDLELIKGTITWPQTEDGAPVQIEQEELDSLLGGEDLPSTQAADDFDEIMGCAPAIEIDLDDLL